MASNTISVRNWEELPLELLELILRRDDALHLLMSARRVCKAWHRVGSDLAMWRVLDLRCPSFKYGIDFETMARRAVDLSSGQLVDLTIAFWATDSLLQYISGSNQLRRLHLVSCDNLTYEGFLPVLKNLPLLEELHFYHIGVPWRVIKAAGKSCKKLKSFKLNQHEAEQHLLCDKEARAVAEFMRGLRHLQLVGNTMSHIGLLSILKACIHLESLDVRQCYNLKPFFLNRGPDLLRILSQHMKNLRLTYDLLEESDRV